MRGAWVFQAATGALLFAISALAQVGTVPKQGLRENDPRVHALTNARVVTAPGKVLEQGTVLIRDGLIVEAGPTVKIPPEARIWDLAGKTIYLSGVHRALQPGRSTGNVAARTDAPAAG
jgi:hypothetical protein